MASRSRLLFLVIVVVLAVGLVGLVGGPAASPASQVAAPAPAPRLSGSGRDATSGTVASVPGQGAVEAPRVLARR